MEPKRKPAMRVRRDGLPTGLAGTLDEVRATVLTLLATLQEEERKLRQRARKQPSAGVHAGLADLYALRAWADRTLETIETVSKGRTGELGALLEELSEFSTIVHARQSRPQA